METFAVIGLGRFGSRLATRLASAGQQVIGIDKRQSVVEEHRDRLTMAIAMDATDEQALRSKGVDKVAAAVIGIGHDFEAATLATVVLKQIGIPRVIARASSPISARVLGRIGADEIVNPEDESADRWAHRLLSPQFLNHIQFHEGHSIVEMACPKPWVGKSLAQLDVRAKTGLHVVAIKRPKDDRDPTGPVRVEMPGPTVPLVGNDTIILMGKDEDFERIPKR